MQGNMLKLADQFIEQTDRLVAHGYLDAVMAKADKPADQADCVAEALIDVIDDFTNGTSALDNEEAVTFTKVIAEVVRKGMGSPANQALYEQAGDLAARLAYTEEEIARMIVEGCVQKAHYWANHPGGDTVQSRCSGVAFSILSMLDGSNLDLPAMALVPEPHHADKDDAIEQGKKYFDPETRVSFALHEMYHGVERELFPSTIVKPYEIDAPLGRRMVLGAAVEIANRHAASGANPADACHAVAKEVLGIFDGNHQGIPPMMVFPAPSQQFINNEAAAGHSQWCTHIPLNRRTSSYGIAEDELLTEGYDDVRRRSIEAAKALFGK